MRRLRSLLVLALGLLRAPLAIAGTSEPPRPTANDPLIHALVPELGEAAKESFARETFRIVSINTGEVAEVEHREGEATEESLASLKHLFRCLRTQSEREVSPALVELLARISKTAGKDIELVSGYRAPLYASDHSFHVRGEAADIRIPGMTALDLKALVLELDAPGVGFYPTSKMIHVDVRETRYRWTDWSAPAGQRLTNR